MKTLRLLFLAFVLAIPARAQVHLLVTTNGALMAPVDFFTLNSNLIVAAIGGALGGGSGNASTNQTQAWAAANTQTFLGPVYFGTTNAVTELAGKQNADAQLDVVANLTSGTATNFLAGDGTFKQVTTNMIPGLVADILAAAAAGGGGDVTLTGTNLFTGPNTFGGATTISNLTVPGTMTVGSISSATPLSLAIGGTGGTNASSARESLGLAIGYDVQAQNAYLQQLVSVPWASGDVPYFDGSGLTNLAMTAAGRTLLTAANAAAQWSALASSATTNGAYNATTWDGITNRVPSLDQFRDVIAALPGGSNSIVSVNTNYFSMDGGYLDWVGGTVGGGGGAGFVYITTNSIGTYTSRADSTNWPILSATIASSNAPVAAGRFIEGAFGGFLTNYSGSLATVEFRASVNGVTVIREEFFLSSGAATPRSVVASMLLIREGDNSATLAFEGSHAPINASTYVGLLDLSSPGAVTGFATNIAVNWSTNVTLDVKWVCATSTATNTLLGYTPFFSYLRRDADATTSGTGDVVGPASATDSVVALYDGTTGKLLKDGTLTEAAINAHLTEAEASALYQGTNDNLTTLGTLNGSALTNLNASSIASGTISSNRLPEAISLTTLSAGTLTATSVSGDGSGLTNLNGSNIASGTVADARIDAALARLASPTFTGSPTVPTAAAGTSNTVAASTKYVDDAVAASGSSFPVRTRFTPVVWDCILGSGITALNAGYPSLGGLAVSSGTSTYISGVANHPGIFRLASAAGANSGYGYGTDITTFRIQGGERFSWVSRPHGTNAGNIVRYGYQDVWGTGYPTDGVFGLRSNNVVLGVVVSNSVFAYTGTSYFIETNTWYGGSVVVNSDATVATYTLTTENGTTLWSDSITNGLPVGDARVCGAGVFTINTVGAALPVEDLDMLAIWNSSTLAR